jgi:hypothetical protein
VASGLEARDCERVQASEAVRVAVAEGLEPSGWLLPLLCCGVASWLRIERQGFRIQTRVALGGRVH